MLKKILKYAGVTAFLGFALPVHGAVIAVYDFPGSQGTTLPSASTDSDAGSTAGSLSLAPYLAPSGGFNPSGTTSSGISSSSGNPVNSLFLRTTNNSTEANAVLFDKYFTFTLTSSTALNFTSLDFDYFRQATTSATSFALRTNAGGDNFSTTVASGSLTGTGAWNSISMDLTGVLGLQNITSATTFRVYIWGSSGASADAQITRFDNIELNALAVPEPGTYALLSLAGIVVLLRRQR